MTNVVKFSEEKWRGLSKFFTFSSQSSRTPPIMRRKSVDGRINPCQSSTCYFALSYVALVVLEAKPIYNWWQVFFAILRTGLTPVNPLGRAVSMYAKGAIRSESGSGSCDEASPKVIWYRRTQDSSLRAGGYDCAHIAREVPYELKLEAIIYNSLRLLFA